MNLDLFDNKCWVENERQALCLLNTRRPELRYPYEM